MKKLTFLMVMVVVLVGLMGGSAFAARYNSTYSTFSGSPHGDYSTSTSKCSACHAVHNPAGLENKTAAQREVQATRDDSTTASEVLLRSSVAGACIYCHVQNGVFDIKTVYDEVEANYNGGGAANYNSAFGHTWDNGAMMSYTGVKCTDCHQVHGAATMMASYNGGTGVVDDGYLYRKILKDQPAYDDDAPAFSANGTTTVDGQNMSVWCSGCHVYYNTAHNGDTHIMGPAADVYDNDPATNFAGKAAWRASTYCRSCHANGETDQTAADNGANDYPHFTAGYRFLNQANSSSVASAAATSANDGTCLTCHASATAGAGITY